MNNEDSVEFQPLDGDYEVRIPTLEVPAKKSQANSVRVVRYQGSNSKGFVLGGGDVYVNGHKLTGVLDLTPNLTKGNDVASVTITLAVSEFGFGPSE